MALFSRLVGGGWGVSDSFAILDKDSSAVISTGTFSSAPRTVYIDVRIFFVSEIVVMLMFVTCFRRRKLVWQQDATLRS